MSFCFAGVISLTVTSSIYESESDVTYSQVWWSILGIRALHLSHPKCTHTAVNTHPKQWAAIYAVVPREQLGVRCLAQGHLSRGIEGGESAGYSLPPPTIPASPRLEPLGYESDSLTIRPRLIQIRSNIFSFLLNPVSLYALKCNVELMDMSVCSHLLWHETCCGQFYYLFVMHFKVEQLLKNLDAS